MNFNKIPKLKIYILYILLSNYSIHPMFSPAMRLNRNLPTAPWANKFDLRPAPSQNPKATIEFSPKEQLSVFKKEESDSQKSATKPQNPTSIKPWYNLINSNATNPTPKLYTPPKDHQLTQRPDRYIKPLRERYPNAPVKLLQDYIAQALATRSDISLWLSGIATTKKPMTPQALKALDPLTVSIAFKEALDPYDIQNALAGNDSQALTLQNKSVKKQPKQQKKSQDKITQPELSKQDSVQDLATLKDPQQETLVIGNKDVLENVFNKNKQDSNASKSTEKSFIDAIVISDIGRDKKLISELMSFNELTNMQLMLKNLWEKGEIPTSDQVRKTLNEIWTNLSKSLKVNISDPIRNIFFKQAIENLPKDPIQSQGWIKSIFKNFFNWFNSIQKQVFDECAQEYKKEIKKENLEDMTIDQQILYFHIKNVWRSPDFLSIKEIEMLRDSANISIEDIAQDFSKDIIQEIMGNRKLSASNMNNLNKEFIHNFIEMHTQPSENYMIFNRLGNADINSHSSQKEIERAYKKGALNVHPDKGGTIQDFQAFKSAYDKIIESKESTHSDKPADQNQEPAFTALIEKLIKAVKKLKEEQINEEKPLKDLALKNLSADLKKNLSDTIIQSIAEKNTNGTTTYRDQNQSITVNSNGKIVSISNVVQ